MSSKKRVFFVAPIFFKTPTSEASKISKRKAPQLRCSRCPWGETAVQAGWLFTWWFCVDVLNTADSDFGLQSTSFSKNGHSNMRICLQKHVCVSLQYHGFYQYKIGISCSWVSQPSNRTNKKQPTNPRPTSSSPRWILWGHRSERNATTDIGFGWWLARVRWTQSWLIFGGDDTILGLVWVLGKFVTQKKMFRW